MTFRRKFLAVAAMVASVLVLASVADARGFRRYLGLRNDLRTLEERNQELSSLNDSLKREIAALRKEPAALERAAREELGYVKPGEIVFHLE